MEEFMVDAAEIEAGIRAIQYMYSTCLWLVGVYLTVVAMVLPHH
jgi:hypothetical protein